VRPQQFALGTTSGPSTAGPVVVKAKRAVGYAVKSGREQRLASFRVGSVEAFGEPTNKETSAQSRSREIRRRGLGHAAGRARARPGAQLEAILACCSRAITTACDSSILGSRRANPWRTAPSQNVTLDAQTFQPARRSSSSFSRENRLGIVQRSHCRVQKWPARSSVSATIVAEVCPLRPRVGDRPRAAAPEKALPSCLGQVSACPVRA